MHCRGYVAYSDETRPAYSFGLCFIMFYTHQCFDHRLVLTVLLFLTVHHNVSLLTELAKLKAVLYKAMFNSES